MRCSQSISSDLIVPEGLGLRRQSVNCLPYLLTSSLVSTLATSLLPSIPKIVLLHLAIVTITFAIWSDHVQKRAPFIYASLLMALVGFSINISNAPHGVKYFGTFFCVSGSYAAFPGVISWCVVLPQTQLYSHSHRGLRLGNNVAGQYKRAASIAMHIGFGNLAGGMFSVLSLINTSANGYCCEAIASNTYRTQDAPRYAIGRQFVILRLQHMAS